LNRRNIYIIVIIKLDLFIKKWRYTFLCFAFKDIHAFKKMTIEMFLFVFTFILIAIFLPYRQADLAASALLQGARGEGPQLRALCLASAATSTCEQYR
jgi:hypothetical protein